jgi:hypothetical protein
MPAARKLPYWVRWQAVEAAFMVLNYEHNVSRRQVLEQLDRWERSDPPNAGEWELWGGKAWAYFDAVAELVKQGSAPMRPLPPPPS